MRWPKSLLHPTLTIANRISPVPLSLLYSNYVMKSVWIFQARRLHWRTIPCECYYFNCFPQVKSNNYTSPSFEQFQPYDFLQLPYEIRHMIYELVIGVDQQIHIKSNLHDCDVPMSLIPCSDHSPAACLQNPVQDTVGTLKSTGGSRIRYTILGDLSYPRLHCQGTALFSHVLHTSNPPDFHTMTVCYDMQSGEQKVTATDISSCNQSAPSQGLTNPSSGMDGLRLLRTCRQIYDEARLVLYKRNTFVFLDFATFAAYLGLAFPSEVYMPRLTHLHRLRAIHSMTKVELRGNVSEASFEALEFSRASRLVRLGLGCLTSLTSFELKLGYLWRDSVGEWKIDDCLFSKPASFKKLVVTLQHGEGGTLSGPVADQPGYLTLHHQDSRVIAETVMRRMVKQEGFTDMEERLLDTKLGFEFWA